MPSFLHEGLVEVLRRKPALAPELLRDAIHVPLPDFDDVRVGDANLTELVPTELRADLVLLLEARSTERPRGVLVVEIQLHADGDKRWTWPAYLAGIRARSKCPAILLVVTADDAVATWASRPIAMGHPDFVLTPLVLGPRAVPIVVDRDVARASPELCVLSAMVHGNEPVAADIATTGAEAFHGLDAERRTLYLDLIFDSIHDAAQAVLEAFMNSNPRYRSAYARRYFDAGEAKGEAAGRSHALLQVLSARGLDVSDQVRARITECTELALLDTWLARALTAASAAEVVGE
jgi:hypothetical protein